MFEVMHMKLDGVYLGSRDWTRYSQIRNVRAISGRIDGDFDYFIISVSIEKGVNRVKTISRVW
jgi:hypothetical protein